MKDNSLENEEFDEYQLRHNCLNDVALTLAKLEINKRRQQMDQDFYDGFNSIAREGGMSPQAYYDLLVEDEASLIWDELNKIPFQSQNLLLAWNELYMMHNHLTVPYEKHPTIPAPPMKLETMLTMNNIPF